MKYMQPNFKDAEKMLDFKVRGGSMLNSNFVGKPQTH